MKRTLKFLGIIEREGRLLASFDTGGKEQLIDGNGTPSGKPGHFVMNEESLRTRIAKMQADGRDVSVEQDALGKLIEKSAERS